MGKSSRIVLLSITAVLAIAVFLVLWAVRPGSGSTLIADARARQSQGLITVDTAVDTAALADELLADGTFIDSIAAALAQNDTVSQSIYDGASQAAESAVASYVDSYVAEHQDEFTALAASAVETYVAQHADQLDAVIDERIRTYVDSILPDIEAAAAAGYVDEAVAGIGSIVDERIQAYVSSSLDELDAIIAADIQAYVDANYDELLSIIRNEIAANTVDESAIADLVAGNVLATIRADVEAYLGQLDLDAIIQRVDSYAASVVDSLLSQANGYTDEKIAQLEDSMLTDSDVQAIVDEAVTSAAAGSTAAPAEVTVRHVVSVPDFESSPVVENEADYSSVRQAERQAAIDSLMQAIGN